MQNVNNVNVIGYARVSTDEQAESGAGLAAQRAAILAEAERRGWTLVEVIEDAGYSGKDLKRPGIVAALDALKHHRADTLIVSKVDRVSRSLVDFAGIMDLATREHWALVALDLGMDTTTPAGQMVAGVLAVLAQWERRIIGQRTRDALAQVKLHGSKSGKPIGRPRTLPEAVRARIVAESAAGRTITAIAEGLNNDQVATARGGRKWYPSTVRAALESAGSDQA